MLRPCSFKVDWVWTPKSPTYFKGRRGASNVGGVRFESAPQTYDKKPFDKKSWVNNHPFSDPSPMPYVRNPHVGLKEFLGQPHTWRFLNSRLGCTYNTPEGSGCV